MKLASPIGRALGIGIGADPPGAGHGRGDQRHVPGAAAEALIVDQRSGGIRRRPAAPSSRVSGAPAAAMPARVAQQRGHMHGLAAAIDAALGIDEGVEPGRHRPAADAAVGQIEGRRLEAERTRNRPWRWRRRAAGRWPPSPRARPAAKCRKPLASVWPVPSTSLSRAISRTSTLRVGLRARQRMDEDVDAVMAAIGGEAEIGNDEPLRGERAVVVARAAPSAWRSSHRRRASACRAPCRPGRRWSPRY